MWKLQDGKQGENSEEVSCCLFWSPRTWLVATAGISSSLSSGHPEGTGYVWFGEEKYEGVICHSPLHISKRLSKQQQQNKDGKACSLVLQMKKLWTHLHYTYKQHHPTLKNNGFTPKSQEIVFWGFFRVLRVVRKVLFLSQGCSSLGSSQGNLGIAALWGAWGYTSQFLCSF